MKESVIKEKNVKIPLYVTVYETLTQWLKEGKYKPGDKLPGENVLSEQLQVSRGTLRQAMLLLQEDGLIINHQGKGNIVLSNQDVSKNGLEKVGNPIVDFSIEPVDRVETTIGFQPATQKHQQVLKLRPSSVVAVIDITYYSGSTPAGFAMIYMPHEILDQSNVNLEDTNTVYQFYTKLLASNGIYGDSKLRMGQARERLANILEIEEGSPILILEEVLYSEYDTPVLSQKLFFGPEQHELSIRRKNDRMKSE
ncbi:GntR family transcriptional regulator [Lacrimispora sp. 210928-DFI.3.58]|uniref:GntR family transcriptional regulator n=1 Tax=Lacrimispora sp. 210928-DFI.3.58 TaxID=2883214 RepID=UPI0015B3A273|nr:GntR family transcriptional regulator [Lacrimispora sp. 210928-DFI.3.58]MCB7320123.1 GntR family transcriptional regulator [Lacrimispora sp. 210928-DFI.3.58]